MALIIIQTVGFYRSLCSKGSHSEKESRETCVNLLNELLEKNTSNYYSVQVVR